jgi:hypothetical protein
MTKTVIAFVEIFNGESSASNPSMQVIQKRPLSELPS